MDSPATASPRPRAPHPVIWTILYLPFGAFSGFVGVGLVFLATKHGLSIADGSLLIAASLLTQWLKWMWAPVIDVTLTPKRWYVISTALSALGVFAMSAVPLSPATLGGLLVIIAVASLVNSVVGMAVEALIGASTTPDQAGRVSAWFQAGNLGGGGLGGGLGLFLLERLPSTWMSGAILGCLFLMCCFALRATADVEAHRREGGARAAVRGVASDLWAMLKTKGGLLSAILCVLPVGTGAAQGVLTQAKIAAHWGAGADEVALIQGLLAGLITAIGCFAGGWLAQRFHPRVAYAGISLAMAAVASAMANSPGTVAAYVGYSMAYSFAVGLSYAAFTAVVLNVMGGGSAATKYNIFASLSNFPLWWLGLLLGWVADVAGPSFMLFTEAYLGLLGVCIFALATRLVTRSKLPDDRVTAAEVLPAKAA